MAIIVEQWYHWGNYGHEPLMATSDNGFVVTYIDQSLIVAESTICL
jgi:hypothetical protein